MRIRSISIPPSSPNYKANRIVATALNRRLAIPRSPASPRSRGAMRPSFANHVSLLPRGTRATLKRGTRRDPKRDAGKTGCALHPRSRVQMHIKKRTRADRFSGNTPAFPAQWFTAYSALSSVTGLSCHRRPQEALASRELDASVGASGPHDFAVRLSAVRQKRFHVHRLPSRVRDDRDTPLVWDGITQISR